MVDLQDYSPGLHGTMTVVGNKKFKLPVSEFMISPLQANAELHINSMVTGVSGDVVIDNIHQGQYTKITGAIPYVEFYVNTNETFYIKW